MGRESGLENRALELRARAAHMRQPLHIWFAVTGHVHFVSVFDEAASRKLQNTHKRCRPARCCSLNLTCRLHSIELWPEGSQQRQSGPQNKRKTGRARTSSGKSAPGLQKGEGHTMLCIFVGEQGVRKGHVFSQTSSSVGLSLRHLTVLMKRA